MDQTTIVGIGASTLTSLALLPQVRKLVREKNAEGISMGMLVILFAGLSLWIWYGILQNDMIVVISNSFALTINVLTGSLAAYYKS
jgi:MtN3 and saliva related transmembrane protein